MAVHPPTRRGAPRSRRPRVLVAVLAAAMACSLSPLAVSDVASAQSVEQTWVEESPTSVPSARRQHAMAYDPVRGQAVLFGGGNGTTNFGDTWEWDGSTWIRRFPASAPSARRLHAMAYDPVRRGVVLFGGFDGQRRNDTWLWDGSTWTQLSPATSPSARSSHLMATAPDLGGAVLFGGYNGSAYVDDTWRWNGITWVDVSGSSRPPAAAAGTMAYDAARGELVRFGGLDASGHRGDTWTWDGSGWTQHFPTSAPSARETPASAFDVATASVVLFGGADASGHRGDTWRWDGSTWIERSPTQAPPARSAAAMVHDTARGRTLLFGGIDSAGYRDDTWTFGTTVEPQPSFPDYPSESPSCQAASNLVRGYVSRAFLQVRTGPQVTGGTAVCVAADDGVAHLGGKLVLNGAPGSPVETDDQAGACAADASNERVQSGILLNQPYALDVTPLPDGSTDVAWVCVQALGTGLRFVVTTSGAGAGTRFEPDALITPPGGYAEEAWPVADEPSAACKAAPAAQQDRVVNVRIGASDRVALYAWRESLTRSHLCMRGQSGANVAGGRFVVDGLGALALASASLVDSSPCTFTFLSRNEWPNFALKSSDPSDPVPPVHACAEVLGINSRVTVLGGGPAVVEFQEDTA